jgi:hypothetical protein
MIGKTIKNIVSQTGVKVCPIVAKIEQTTKPYIVYNLDSISPDYHKDLSIVPIQLSYTITIYGNDFDEIEAISLQIFNLMRVYKDETVVQIRVVSMQDSAFDTTSLAYQRDISINASIQIN